jgi:hypothetical protein
LDFLRPEGQDHTPSWGELIEQGRRRHFGCGCDQDLVKGRMLKPNDERLRRGSWLAISASTLSRSCRILGSPAQPLRARVSARRINARCPTHRSRHCNTLLPAIHRPSLEPHIDSPRWSEFLFCSILPQERGELDRWPPGAKSSTT